jgi:hypothetical protein
MKKALLMLILAVAILVAAGVLLAKSEILKTPLVVSNQESLSFAPSSTAVTQTHNESLIIPALVGVFLAVVLVKLASLLFYIKNRNC